MRPASKANWNKIIWEEYVNEAHETSKNLEKLGAKESAAYWQGLAVTREAEFKKAVIPTIPYQD